MKLTELHVKNFGKFHNKSMILGPNINIIYGENESGKTTLHTFIRSILFGIKKSRGRAAKHDMFNSYSPWDSKGYDGIIKFDCGNKQFRLQRDFSKSNQEAVLVCESDGECLSVESGDLEMLLGDIGEIIYDNTVSIGQLKSETNQEMVEELKSFLANMEGTGVADLYLDQALNKLKKEQKTLEMTLKSQKLKEQEQNKFINQKIEYLEDEITVMDQKLTELKRNINKLQEQKNELEEKKHLEEKKIKEQKSEIKEMKQDQHLDKKVKDEPDIQIEEEDLEYDKQMRGMTIKGFIISFFCFIIGLFLMDNIFLKGLFLLLGVLVGGYFIYVMVTNGQEYDEILDEVDDDEHTQVGEVYEEYLYKVNHQLSKIEGAYEQLEEQLNNKRIELDNYQQEVNELVEVTYRHDPITEDIHSIHIASTVIQKLSKEMQNQISGLLSGPASEILCMITNNRYKRLFIDDSFQLGVDDGMSFIPIQRVSRGTMDQIYFALRMAMAQVVCEEELPFILDDAFAMYDEERLREILLWMSKQNRQFLIFTCHKREAEILTAEGIRFTPIYI